jgi:PKD repeat protein
VVTDTFITAGISTADAQLLRQTAHSTVQDSLSKWLTDGHIPVASFTHTTAGMQVSLTSHSINGQQFSWDYGDSHSGTGATATHTYAASGTYTVTLYVTNHCMVSKVTDTVTVTHTGIADEADMLARVYPTPTQGLLYIDLLQRDVQKDSRITVLNSMGQVLKILSPTGIKTCIDISDMADGLYHISVWSEGKMATYSVLLKR